MVAKNIVFVRESKIMAPKIFSAAEKEQLKEQMFLSGLELLKKHGMTHMSVEKITAEAGIGKSTFYNFFMSKEDFVIQLIEYNRMRFWNAIQNMLNGREKLDVSESKKILTMIINSRDSVYQYLTVEDENKLAAASPEYGKVDIDEESEILKHLFSMFEGVRKDADIAVISNLLKILALTAENRSILHESGYKRTQDKLFETLFNCIFEE